MGLLAFTEFCRWAITQPARVTNPYHIHLASESTLTDLLYCREFWYGLVCDSEWAASLY